MFCIGGLHVMCEFGGFVAAVKCYSDQRIRLGRVLKFCFLRKVEFHFENPQIKDMMSLNDWHLLSGHPLSSPVLGSVDL